MNTEKMREEYKKITGWDATLEPCPFCGSPAELWEYSPTENHYQKVVMCSNAGDEDGGREECPMYMPPQGFYKATKIEARNIWNDRQAARAGGDGEAVTIENAPLGTKAPAIGGGHWTRTERGWKWCTGATFPRPGGDWTGELIPPAPAANSEPWKDGWTEWFTGSDGWSHVKTDVLERHGLYMPAQAAKVPEIKQLEKALSLHKTEIECLQKCRDDFKRRAIKAEDYAETLSGVEDRPIWFWQGDGEDHLESMASSLTVIISATQLRDMTSAAKVPDVCASSDSEHPTGYACHKCLSPVSAPTGFSMRVWCRRCKVSTAVTVASDLSAAPTPEGGG